MTVPAKCEKATDRQITDINAKKGFGLASKVVEYGAVVTTAMQAHAEAMAHNHGSIPRFTARPQ